MQNSLQTLAPDVADSFMALVKQPFSWLKLLYAVLLLIACLVVMKILMSVLNRSIEKLKVEKSLHTFIKSVAKILLGFLTLVIVLGYVGVPVTSLIAVLSVAGLAISLAIQGTLSNLAGGIMVLVSKPFKLGDYIQVGTIEGSVADIGLVYTRIKTFDNKLIFVPNGQISADKIINYTSQDSRRVDLKFTTAYEADPDTVCACIAQVVGVHSKALYTPAPFIRLSAYRESCVEYTLRVWCATGDYWDLYYDLLEQVGAAFRAQGIEMTYNHLNVHMQ
ncbi:MAG: mechanosensitive ion channel family protein [Pseudoflavonifractor sp.]